MKLILLIISVSIFAGCYSNHMVIASDSKAFLKIEGNKKNISIKIDEKPLQLSENFFKKHVLLNIKPGIHFIKIYRNDILIVERKMNFEAGVSTEIKL